MKTTQKKKKKERKKEMQYAQIEKQPIFMDWKI